MPFGAPQGGGLPPIPDYAELFKGGTLADRNAARALLAVAPAPDVALRRKLAEAKRRLESERTLPGQLDRLEQRYRRAVKADKLRERIERDYRPGMNYEHGGGSRNPRRPRERELRSVAIARRPHRALSVSAPDRALRGPAAAGLPARLCDRVPQSGVSWDAAARPEAHGGARLLARGGV